MCLREGFGRRKPLPDLDPFDCDGAEVLGLDASSMDELLELFRGAYDAEKEIFS